MSLSFDLLTYRRNKWLQPLIRRDDCEMTLRRVFRRLHKFNPATFGCDNFCGVVAVRSYELLRVIAEVAQPLLPMVVFGSVRRVRLYREPQRRRNRSKLRR